LRPRTERSARVPAEDILLDSGLRTAGSIQEEIIRIEAGIANILPGIKMVPVRAAFQDGVDIAAAVAALSGIIEAGAYLELLDCIGSGKGSLGQLTERIVGSRDSFDQVVVIVFAPSVHIDSHEAAAQLRGIVQVRRRAR